jgi:hypothetical protein
MSGSADATLRRVLGLGLTVAVLLGAAASGGSVLRRTATEVTTRQALPYAVIGAAAALVAAALVLGALRLTRAGSLGLRPIEWVAAVLVVAAIGGLLGIARTPRHPTPQEVSPLDESTLSERDAQTRRLGDDARAGPVDLDGDGVPDLDAAGREIIAIDRDGDGRFDEYLQPCPPGSPETEQRAGSTALDVACDGSVDRWLAYDRNIFLDGDERFVAEPPSTVAPQERADRAEAAADEQRDDVIGTVLLALLVLAVGIAIVVVIVRLPDRHGDAGAGDEPDGGIRSDAGRGPAHLGRTMAESLDVMLAGADPRTAICAAYGRLLEGFAEVGLGRRTEEAPEEHITRCLAAARVDPRPVRQLVQLFMLARFSDHPVDETHRGAAVAAMQEALAGVAPRVPVPAGAPAGAPRSGDPQ